VHSSSNCLLQWQTRRYLSRERLERKLRFRLASPERPIRYVFGSYVPLFIAEFDATNFTSLTRREVGNIYLRFVQLDGNSACSLGRYSLIKRGRRKLFPQMLSPTGKHPISMAIGREKFEVRTWKDVFLKTCEVVRARNTHRFHEILTLRGYKHPWFSRDPSHFRQPTKISGTNIFAETNESANGLLRRSLQVMQLFSMKPDIEVETKE